MAKRIFNWGLVIIWMGVIFYFSSLSILKSPTIDTVDFIVKKSAHVSEYAILFLLLHRAFDKKHWQISFLISLLYAFSDETHQLFSPGRGASLRDIFLFDSLGIILASWKNWKVSR